MWTKIITNILGFGLSLLLDAVKQRRHRERFLSLEDASANGFTILYLNGGTPTLISAAIWWESPILTRP
jgi:hypothetical protein